MKSALSRFKPVIFIICSVLLASCGQEKVIKTVSTIDSTLQVKVNDILVSSMKNDRCDWGCAVLMKTQTGEIIAISNLSGDTTGSSYSDTYDFATFKQIMPGHMFSLAALMAGFEDKYFSSEDIVKTENGECMLCDFKITDKNKGAGDIPIYKAFALGSNVGIAKIIVNSYKEDQQALIDRIKYFNLDLPLGADSVEPPPYFNKPESANWAKASLPLFAIGYECKMTPLQIMGFYNSVATGKIIRPVFEKNDTTRLPIVNNEMPYSTKTLISARQLVDSIQISDLGQVSEKVRFSGHTATVENSGTFKSYTKILCAYFPTEKPEYTWIIVLNNYSENCSSAISSLKDILDVIYNDNSSVSSTNNVNSNK